MPTFVRSERRPHIPPDTKPFSTSLWFGLPVTAAFGHGGANDEGLPAAVHVSSPPRANAQLRLARRRERRESGWKAAETVRGLTIMKASQARHPGELPIQKMKKPIGC
jgi:hypothetical protein